MMLARKVTFPWIFLALVSSLAAGAGASSVEYWTSINREADERAYFLDIFAEKYPDVNVVYQLQPGAGYYDKLLTALATGSGPDIFYTVGQWIPHWVKHEFVYDVARFFERDLDPSRFFQAAIDEGRFPPDSPSLYAVPTNFVASVLFYNKNHFDAAGLPYPDGSWTYQTLAETAAKLRRDVTGDGEPDQYGLLVYGTHVDLDPAIYANGGRVISADGTRSEVNSTVGVETLRFFAELTTSGIAATPNDFPGQPRPFLSGQVSMEINGSYNFRWYEPAPFEWDIAPVPRGTVRRAAYGGSDMLAMSAAAKDPEAAWKVLRSNLEDRRPGYFIGGFIPVLRETAQSPEWLDQPPAGRAVLLEQAADVVTVAGNNWGQWNAQKNQIYREALLGRISPEEAVIRVSEMMNVLLAE